MNRKQFQELAEIRLVEAKTLLDARHSSGAYYLAGYAIECGLEACIAKMTKRYEKHPQLKARDRHQAVSDPDHGVLSWIKRHW